MTAMPRSWSIMQGIPKPTASTVPDSLSIASRISRTAPTIVSSSAFWSVARAGRVARWCTFRAGSTAPAKSFVPPRSTPMTQPVDTMGDDTWLMPDPEPPPKRPEYRVYRSRKALLPGRERDELAQLRSGGRGHDRGPREQLPGNDQTGAALAGVSWMEGGVESGAMPIWPITSLGDTGNGFLSAIGVVQALYHRDRTGEGQFVDTSILYAHLLNASMAWVSPDGTAVSDRPKLDLLQTGWSARYRLYETADGWLCLAAVTDGHLAALGPAVGRDLPVEDAALAATLEEVFATRPAVEWVRVLDAAGVPAEVSDPDFVLSVFDDPELIEKGWVTSYEQGIVGRMDVQGLLVDLSDTPGKIQGPPLVPGQDTRAILDWLGYDDERVEKLLASGAAAEA